MGRRDLPDMYAQGLRAYIYIYIYIYIYNYIYTSKCTCPIVQEYVDDCMIAKALNSI